MRALFAALALLASGTPRLGLFLGRLEVRLEGGLESTHRRELEGAEGGGGAQIVDQWHKLLRELDRRSELRLQGTEIGVESCVRAG
mgnify:CR=1 FL=1